MESAGDTPRSSEGVSADAVAGGPWGSAEMRDYSVEGRLGSGAFGIVLCGRRRRDGLPVALKRVTLPSLEGKRTVTVMRELHSLQAVSHPYVIHLMDSFPYEEDLVLVFERCCCDLAAVLKARRLSLPEVRGVAWQIAQGVAAIHAAQLLHRDLKPNNVLLSYDGQVRLGDFGLASPADRPLTPYVSTRWYRAPEVLLGSTTYGAAADMWAFGTILAELLTGAPLVPGSGDIDQLARLIQLFGQFTYPGARETLPDLHKLEFNVVGDGPTFERRVLPTLRDPQAADLVQRLLQLDPARRLTAAEVLCHPFFFGGARTESLDVTAWRSSE